MGANGAPKLPKTSPSSQEHLILPKTAQKFEARKHFFSFPSERGEFLKAAFAAIGELEKVYSKTTFLPM